MGGDFQHGSLGEERTARAALRQRNAADVATSDAGDAVVVGEALIEHREVGFHEVGDAEVFRDQLAQVGARFRDHAVLQVLASFGVKLRVGLGGVDLPQVEPLVGEVGDEAIRAWIGQEAVGLLSEVLRQVQAAFVGEREELRDA